MEKERLWSERNEIISSLSKRERRILYNYEQEYGRLFPGAIQKVIDDQIEFTKPKSKGKKVKRK